MAKTLFDKVWERHVVDGAAGEAQLIYIDLQMIHEVTSPQAFEGLRMAGRSVRRPDKAPRRGPGCRSGSPSAVRPWR